MSPILQHLEIEDVLYFPVNHTNNYVDPITGAHTQTIEGLWRHCKEHLPSYGMKPVDLQEYLGSFMWIRYCKQRKLDMFMEMMKCTSAEVPPFQSSLPIGTCVKTTEDMKDPDFV